MGSYVFTVGANGELGVEEELGESWRALVRYNGTAPRGVAFASIPPQSDLEMLCRTLRILHPPESHMKRGSAALSTPPLINYQQTYSFTYRPTDIRKGNYRAWLVEQNWLGKDIHNARGFYSDAVWLDEEKAILWASAQQKHPLVRLLSKESDLPSLVFAPADTDVETWEDAWVHYQGYRLLTERDGIRKQTGVYLQLHVQFGRWSGTILVSRPKLWKLRIELGNKPPLVPPHRVIAARNGRETRLFSYDGSLGQPALYTAELPKSPQYEALDVSGKYATFWNSSAAWREYAQANRICALRPLPLAASEPLNLNEEILVTLTQEEAEKAYQAGAGKLPQVVFDLGVEDFVEVSGPGNSTTFRVESVDHPCVGATSNNKPGDDQFLVFLPAGFRGWIRPGPRVQVSHGVTVREAGDKSRHSTEFCVLTSGEVINPKH